MIADRKARRKTGAVETVVLAGIPSECEDLRYVTGFRASDPVVVVMRGRRKVLVVPDLELGRARRTAGFRVESARTLGLQRDARRRLSEWILAVLRSWNVRAIRVASRFPHGIAEALIRRGIRVVVQEGALFASRAIKSPEEVAYIRESQQAAVIAMRRAVALIAGAEIGPGGALRHGHRNLTSEDVRRLITRILSDRDCACRDAIVACGVQSADPHETGRGALKAGECIVLDIFPRHQEHGYWGDLTRTVVRGPARPALRRMYQAVYAAQTAALKRIRPRVHVRSVHGAACEVLAARGFRTEIGDERIEGFIHGTGHGVGLSIHEAPVIGNDGARLRAGHVVTVEPGLYYPEIGGVRIEDTVLVTPGGWRFLASCEKRFEL